MEEKIIYINNEESNYIINEYGEVFNRTTKEKLKGNKSPNNWYYSLFYNGNRYCYTASQLMIPFLSEKPNDGKYIIGHKDGNKYNDHKDNLYWLKDNDWRDIYIDGNLTCYEVNRLGEIRNKKTGNVLKGDTSKTYCYYTLKWGEKVKHQKMKSGHRIVAEAFIPNPNNLPYVHHKDHNRLNNCVENLEWVTEEENANDIQPFKNTETFRSLNFSSLENEYWKVYKDTNYEISNYGRVKNLKTMIIKTGNLRDDGYMNISINSKNLLLHRVVVETFIRPLKENEYVDHINGVKTDNRLENLQIVSHQENMKRAARNGKCGAKRVGQFDFEGNLIQIFPSASEAGRQMGILPSSMRNAIRLRGKYKNFIFKYLDESSQTNRDENPKARSDIS